VARRPKPADSGRVTGADIIHFIERFCFVPEGGLVGQPLLLAEWQKAEIQKIYDNPAGTRRVIISMGRKNAKTTLSACLLLAHLCGPAAKQRPNSQLYSAAQSRDQASIIFSLAAKIVRMNPELARAVTIQESIKQLTCPELGTRYRALSADATTAYGLSPAFIVHDELGQISGPRSELYEALETATGAQTDPLSIIISTQAPSDQDLLSILIDDALAGNDPHTLVSLYTAPPSLDPFSEDAIRAANPAFGSFLNAREVLQMAADAKRMPARQRAYENLVLNRRVQVVTAFVPPSVWDGCGGPPSSLEGLQVYGGLDLSAVSDLTALVLIGWRNSKWNVNATFWLPGDGLAEKAAQDHAPYDLWHAQGYLQLSPGKTVSYEFVAHELRRLFKLYNIEKLGFDRWNFRHLRPWLVRAGFPEQMIKDRFVEFGQGMQSMSPALRDLEQILLDGQLVHGSNPLLNLSVAHAVVVTDDAGNRKPSKRKSTSRIDGLVALLMAIGVAPLQAKAIDIEALIA
jgi:phage terminase large subunit-like protein